MKRSEFDSLTVGKMFRLPPPFQFTSQTLEATVTDVVALPNGRKAYDITARFFGAVFGYYQLSLSTEGRRLNLAQRKGPQE